MRIWLIVPLLILLMVPAAIKWRYGGGENFPSMQMQPLLDGGDLQVVANLPEPPGNLAVSGKGRVFFTFHPEARPLIKVAEWTGTEAKPWPTAAYQSPDGEVLGFQNVLSIRIDQQNRLWVLDNAGHGLGQPRLLAFDLDSGELEHHFDFPREIAPRLSHLNDFQVSNDGRYVFIADASVIGLTPAIIVYDSQSQSARRLLEGDVSVEAEPYVLQVSGRRMEIYGLFALRPGVDSIALSRDNQWLYFAAVTATKMYRVKTADLFDTSLSAEALAQRVQAWADKPATDGITTDSKGNVYLTDPVNSAVHRLNANNGQLVTLVTSDLLRWPDGFSFGPNGWLYVTASALEDIVAQPEKHQRAQAPYQILRFQPGASAVAGH